MVLEKYITVFSEFLGSFDFCVMFQRVTIWLNCFWLLFLRISVIFWSFQLLQNLPYLTVRHVLLKSSLRGKTETYNWGKAERRYRFTPMSWKLLGLTVICIDPISLYVFIWKTAQIMSFKSISSKKYWYIKPDNLFDRSLWHNN